MMMMIPVPIHPDHHHLNHPALSGMKTKAIVTLFLLGHLFDYVPILLYWISPNLSEKELHPFIGSDMAISPLWYIKHLGDNLLWIIVFFVFCRISQGVRYYINLVFLLYHIVDFCLYLWNYKQSYGVYLNLLGLLILTILPLSKLKEDD